MLCANDHEQPLMMRGETTMSDDTTKARESYSFAAIKDELEDSLSHPLYAAGYIRTITVHLRDSISEAARIAQIDEVIGGVDDTPNVAPISLLVHDGQLAVVTFGRRHILTSEMPVDGDTTFMCSFTRLEALQIATFLDGLVQYSEPEVFIALNGKRVVFSQDRRRTDWLDVARVDADDPTAAYALIEEIQTASPGETYTHTEGLRRMVETIIPVPTCITTTEAGLTFEVRKPVRFPNGVYDENGRWVVGAIVNEGFEPNEA